MNVVLIFEDIHDAHKHKFTAITKTHRNTFQQKHAHLYRRTWFKTVFMLFYEYQSVLNSNGSQKENGNTQFESLSSSKHRPDYKNTHKKWTLNQSGYFHFRPFKPDLDLLTIQSLEDESKFIISQERRQLSLRLQSSVWLLWDSDFNITALTLLTDNTLFPLSQNWTWG